MPITLPALSRRKFLAGSLAAGAALLARRYSFGATASSVDPHRFALLSDIHIPADQRVISRGVNMADHLRQVCAEVLQLDKAPACAIVNGDCAHLKGLSEDYATVIELVRPLREAGIPLHMAMGNHDQRDNFWQALPADENRTRALADRQVLVFETPRANWIMLDSLDKTNSTPGVLGAAQLQWLAKTLDERAGKPAIVFVHHNLPYNGAHPITQPATTPAIFKLKPTGLIDGSALLDIVLPRKQVKALLYGHSHVWHIEKREGMHLINLPAVAYVFTPPQPSAWVDAHLGEQSMSLELRCLDPGHAWHGQKHELEWRG
jgi:3',5'-cyclic AMP phosphodiesterase CpdA